MWSFFGGKIISLVFSYLIIKYYKNNLSRNNLTKFERLLGWFFQEHIREDFNMTSGKRFMTNIDFRNKFITNIIKIIRNLVFWSHLINIFELGSLVVMMIFLLILVSVHIETKYGNEYNYKQRDFLSLFFVFVYIYLLFHVYGLYDFYYLGWPLSIGFALLCFGIYIFIFVYLIFTFLYFTPQIEGKYIKFFIFKNFIYLPVTFLIGSNIYLIINFEQFYSNNFYQELLIQALFIFQYINSIFLK